MGRDPELATAIAKLMKTNATINVLQTDPKSAKRLSKSGSEVVHNKWKYIFPRWVLVIFKITQSQEKLFF